MPAILLAAIAVIALGPAVAGIVWLVSRRRIALGITAASVILGAAWWIDLALISRDYRDLDGLMDCHPHCTAEQKAAALVLFYTPLVMAAILVALLTFTAAKVWKARRGSPPRPETGPPAASRR
jgi:hypothetical protein